MAASDAPPGVNLRDDQQPAVLGAIIFTWLLVLIVFGCRLLCRRIMRTSLRLDDWLIIPAIVLATLQSLVIVVYMIPNNFGKHIYLIPDDQRESRLLNLRIGIFIFQQVWVFGILSVKASVLALYWRLFSRSNTVRYQVMFWTVIVSCWGFEYFITKLLYCRPIQGLWNDKVKMKCTVNTSEFIFINGVINTITDAALLFIPLPAIWSLSLEFKQKVALTGVFLAGFACTATSITRLVYMKRDYQVTTTIEDVPWNLTWTTTWTALELNIAVVCGCLPQLRPLLTIFPATPRKSENKKPYRHTAAGTSHFSSFKNAAIRTIGSTSSRRLVPSAPGARAADVDEGQVDVYLELGSVHSGRMDEGDESKLVKKDELQLTDSEGESSKEKNPHRDANGRKGSTWNVRVLRDWTVTSERGTPAGETRDEGNKWDVSSPK